MAILKWKQVFLNHLVLTKKLDHWELIDLEQIDRDKLERFVDLLKRKVTELNIIQ